MHGNEPTVHVIISDPTVKQLCQSHVGTFHSCGRLSRFTAPHLEEIGPKAFMCCRNLVDVSLASCKFVDDDAFGGYTNPILWGQWNRQLTISLPSIEAISPCAFTTHRTNACEVVVPLVVNDLAKDFGGNWYTVKFALDKLSRVMKNVCGAMVKLEVTDPNVTGLGQGGTVGMFAGSGLQALSLEHVAEVGALTFLDCSHLKEVSLPNATIIGSNAFGLCMDIERFHSPKVTTVKSKAFKCGSFPKIHLPLATNIEEAAFEDCWDLRHVSIHPDAVVAKRAFESCACLEVLAGIIRKANMGEDIRERERRVSVFAGMMEMQRRADGGVGWGGNAGGAAGGGEPTVIQPKWDRN
ncbi:hypothetical protein TrRE_jg12410, partial [Triparma retinervis]